jgi:protein-tyrosine phosphatase
MSTSPLNSERQNSERQDFERQPMFDGCFNFRDLGGYTTHDGGAVAPRRLYRADGPHELSPFDVDKLLGLDLQTVIDLRTLSEAHERGRYVTTLVDVTEHHLPMVDVLPDPDELPDWIDPKVVAIQYRNMFDQGRATIAEALTILSDPNAYPAVFHCSAGKDRTGILAAIVLALLGVPDETIVADYALSAQSMQRLIDYYTRSYPDAGERLTRLAPAMVAAHPEAMGAFLASVRSDFGTFDAYAESIGVPGAARSLGAHLLI